LEGKRSRHWLKVKRGDSTRCRVVGYTTGRGSRAKSFGAQAIAAETARKWSYRGKVGSGLTDQEIAALVPQLQTLEADSPPFAMADPGNICWVRPALQSEVVYQAQTSKGRFRAPVFRGWVA